MTQADPEGLWTVNPLSRTDSLTKLKHIKTFKKNALVVKYVLIKTTEVSFIFKTLH